jgi:hypothetical protein
MDSFPIVVFMWAFLQLPYKNDIYLQIMDLWDRFKDWNC